MLEVLFGINVDFSDRFDTYCQSVWKLELIFVGPSQNYLALAYMVSHSAMQHGYLNCNYSWTVLSLYFKMY